jgi:uncharacterized membrane protein YhfC
VLIAATIVQILFAIGAPILLAVFIGRRYRVKPILFAAGAVSFVGSQILHIPLLIALTAAFKHLNIPKEHTLAFNAVVLGLAAGICEEPARYVVYRWWMKDARSYGDALALGTGHGGIESILLVGLGGLGVLAILAHPPATDTLPPEAAAKIKEILTMPAYMPLLGAFERAIAILLHLANSVLVLQCFTRKSMLWLFLAIVWHALIDGVAVACMKRYGVVTTEAVVAAMSVISIAILVLLRPRDAAKNPEPAST